MEAVPQSEHQRRLLRQRLHRRRQLLGGSAVLRDLRRLQHIDVHDDVTDDGPASSGSLRWCLVPTVAGVAAENQGDHVPVVSTLQATHSRVLAATPVTESSPPDTSSCHQVRYQRPGAVFGMPDRAEPMDSLQVHDRQPYRGPS